MMSADVPGKSSTPGAEPQLKPAQRAYGAGYKLIGKNYTTADLMAKVTGKAKYAEDFRAEGMLFCKLVLSPMPHARIKRVHLDDALAIPGVKAILTADDIPAPADSLNDNGAVIKASKWGERALTNEPIFQGDPILAVAAVDEVTAAEAIEAIRIDFEPLPFVIDPLESLRPGGPNPREDGNVWVRPAPPAPQTPELTEVKWTEKDFEDYSLGKLPMGHAPEEWSYGDLDEGTAIASANRHGDHFGATFGIETTDGAAAHRACLGWGLERVSLALVRTHGTDVAGWPAEVLGLLGVSA